MREAIKPEGGNDSVALDIGHRQKVVTYKVDLVSREAIYQAAALVKKQVGSVDILVNNAGVLPGKRLLDSSDAENCLVFRVNTLAPIWVRNNITITVTDVRSTCVVGTG